MKQQDIGQRTASPRVIAVLRRRTQAVHERLHTHPMLAPLTAPDLTPPRYIDALRALHRFHQSVERALADYPAKMTASTALARDIEHLAGAGNPLPPCPALPRVQQHCAALGVHYVVYGSALGGRLIARSVARTLGWPDDAPGLSHFRRSDADDGHNWRRFLRDDLAECRDREVCAEAALATFTALENWLWTVHREHVAATA